MILKLIIKNNKKTGKNDLKACIQKNKDVDNEIKQILQFFKDNIKISTKRRFYNYYKVNSDNPAIIMSLFSTVLDLIPDVYFNSEETKD